MRPLAGPLAWLGSLPFVSSIPQAVSVLGRVGAATAVATGAVAVGTLNVRSHTTSAPSALPAALAPVSSPPEPGPGPTGNPSPTARHAPVGPPPSTATTVVSAGEGGGGPSGVGGPSPTSTTTTPAAVPASPTAVSVKSGDADVTVSWSAPNDGGAPLTSFTVTPYIGAAAQTPDTVSPSTTSQVMGGLTNGTTYTFTVTATNAVGSGAPSTHSSPVTPVAPSLTIVNGGGKAGRAQGGDQIVVTYSPPPTPSAFCAAWTDIAYPDLADANVVVQGTQPTSGDDTITVTDTADCNGGFHFGTVDLGQRGYFTGTVTFGGSVVGCKNAKTAGCSTIHWDGKNTLTITLGKESAGQPLQTAPSIAVYTPDPALGFSGTISSVKEENF
jgi:hypothetical protein